MNKSSDGGYEPKGQQGSGTPAVSMPNPKTQPSSLYNGSVALPSDSAQGYAVASDRNGKGQGGFIPSDDVVNTYVTTDEAGEPPVAVVSANRVYRVQP